MYYLTKETLNSLLIILSKLLAEFKSNTNVVHTLIAKLTMKFQLQYGWFISHISLYGLSISGLYT